ncbi:MAG: glutamate ABC transporter substrate-binding protein [Gordonia sp. (in: high G+C Gram-positive bacteria)]
MTGRQTPESPTSGPPPSGPPLHRTRRSLRSATLDVIAIAVGVLLVSTLCACGGTTRTLLDSIRSGDVIVGTKFDQPGLSSYHPNKSMSGFDPAVSVYVVNHIADSLGVHHPKITWREAPSAQREALLDHGEVDMIAATYSITPERAQKISFAGPYLITYQGLMVRSDDTSIQTLSDLARAKKLCSVTGSTSAQNVTAQLPDVELQEYDSYSACVEALRRGNVDAMTTDESILAGYNAFWRNQFRLVDMTYRRDTCVGRVLARAGDPFATERYGIGVAKGDQASVDKINDALTAMIAPAADDGPSAWITALRANLGDSYVHQIDSRTAQPNSRFAFTPVPGDLAFLTAKPTSCPGA